MIQGSSSGFVTLTLFVDAHKASIEKNQEFGNDVALRSTEIQRVNSVLFLCLAGTDRSAAAMGWLRKLSPVTVTEAAALSPHFSGARPSTEMERLAQEKGIALQNHRAKKYSMEQVGKADLIVFFEVADLIDFREEHRDRRDILKKTRLLLDYLGESAGHNRALADPHSYGNHQKCFKMIETGVRAMIEKERIYQSDEGMLDILTNMKQDMKVLVASNQNLEKRLQTTRKEASKVQKLQSEIKSHAMVVAKLVEDNENIQGRLVETERNNSQLHVKLDLSRKECKDHVDEIRRLNKKLTSCIDRLKTEICSRKALWLLIPELMEDQHEETMEHM
eukprot:jgi/Bigna1/129475/aug1.9_g4183